MSILHELIPDRKFTEDVYKTIFYLQSMFRQYDGNNEGESFRWLKTDLTPLRFADFIFAYKNTVFAVLVLQERKNEHGISYFDEEGRKYYLFQECRKNNFVPCKFYLYKDESKSFNGKGFNLHIFVHQGGSSLDPVKTASDKPVEVSDWELKNWSVDIVMQYLRKEGYKIKSCSDDPGVEPNIWFEDKNGKISWVQVLHTRFPDNDKNFSLRNFSPSVLMHDGYKAVVGFANAEDINLKLYRSKGVFINFRGITQIYSGGTEIHEEVLPHLNKEEFLRELDKLIALEGDLNLPDELIEGRSDFLFILYKLMHYKLTVEELNDSFIFLLNLMCANQPKLAVSIHKDDTIRMPFAMLDEILPTKGKLTREEKLVYAYCVFRACRMSYLDEETDQMHLGIRLMIKYHENIIASLKMHMKQFPEYFAFLKAEQNIKYPFAATKQNPVKAISINDGYKYLRNLITRDYMPVNFERRGSFEGVNGGIIDGYDLFYIEDGQQKSMRIYIDPYSNENSTEAPEGLRLLNNESGLNHYDETDELLRLAENGNAQAQYELGEKLTAGDGVVEDYHAAFKWFMRASIQHHLLAQNAIGLAYVKGLGVKQNYQEAFHLFHEAAMKGCYEALNNWNYYNQEFYQKFYGQPGPTMYF